MSVVREEFGPTLPELLAPRLRRLPLAGRVAVGALALAVVVALAWLALRPPPGEGWIVVHKPIAFNLITAPGVERVAPRAGELLRLRANAAGAETFTVRRLAIPRYRGDVTTELTFMASGLIDDMQAHVPGFVLRSEGRARILASPGYQIVYQVQIGRHTGYGRRVLLVPDPGIESHPRVATDIDVRAARSPAIPNADAVGNNGVLKTPLRSFRFGTQRP
jgi:hypothetical protein